jgi:hypothetical protein
MSAAAILRAPLKAAVGVLGAVEQDVDAADAAARPDEVPGRLVRGEWAVVPLADLDGAGRGLNLGNGFSVRMMVMVVTCGYAQRSVVCSAGLPRDGSALDGQLALLKVRASGSYPRPTPAGGVD